MSYYILGAKTRVARLGEFKYTPDNGRIGVESTVTGHYETMSVKEALFNLKSLNDMIKQSIHTGGVFYPDEIEGIQRFIEDMIEVLRAARAQGEPKDPRLHSGQHPDAGKKHYVMVPQGGNGLALRPVAVPSRYIPRRKEKVAAKLITT